MQMNLNLAMQMNLNLAMQMNRNLAMQMNRNLAMQTNFGHHTHLPSPAYTGHGNHTDHNIHGDVCSKGFLSFDASGLAMFSLEATHDLSLRKPALTAVCTATGLQQHFMPQDAECVLSFLHELSVAMPLPNIADVFAVFLLLQAIFM